MSILSRAVSAISGTKINTERLPQNFSGGIGYTGGSLQPTGQVAQLASMASVGWLFSVVNRIAQSIAATEWKLYTVQNGEKEEVDNHPAIELWRNQDDFITREDFLETSAQHMELVGEMWWVLVRNGLGVPIGLQVVRPDRMKPIPHPTEYIAGYEYRIGSTTIQLERDDVIFTRNPNPLDAYRGIGVVQSMMVDLGAERLAAEWQNNFFKNSAMPTGIIEFDSTLQDSDFERLAARWRMQHQGVANSNRVAILERGKWVDAKITQHDMQFEQLRRFERDQILGAFGMPLPIMGITESVNRANAEAAHYMYATWLIRPRLMRIRAALNSKLLKLYPDGENLMFDFVDQTPENRVELANEGSLGYEKGVLTLNEARRRFGEDDLDTPEGNERKPSSPPPPPPSDPPVDVLEPPTEDLEEEVEASIGNDALMTKVEANDEYIEEGNKTANRIERGWKRRFAIEGRLLTDFIESGSKNILSMALETKLTPSDINDYDWNWWAKYGDEVIDELAEAFALVIQAEAPNLTLPLVQRLSGIYAETRGAELLQVDGPLNLVNSVRMRVGALVSDAVKEGQSIGTLAANIRAMPELKNERARMIARTETAKVLGQGQKQAAKSQGRSEKRWVTQGDALVAIECQLNEAMGWIPIEDLFTGGVGVDTIPEHVNCRCVVQFRDKPITESDKSFAVEVRCPQCDRKNGENVLVGTEIKCRRCKYEWEVMP